MLGSSNALVGLCATEPRHVDSLARLPWFYYLHNEPGARARVSTKGRELVYRPYIYIYGGAVVSNIPRGWASRAPVLTDLSLLPLLSFSLRPSFSLARFISLCLSSGAFFAGCNLFMLGFHSLVVFEFVGCFWRSYGNGSFGSIYHSLWWPNGMGFFWYEF